MRIKQNVRIIHTSKSMGKDTFVIVMIVQIIRVVRINEGQIIQTLLYV